MYCRFHRAPGIICPLLFALQLGGCGLDDGSQSGFVSDASPAASTVITGSVGDGPIAGASLHIFDRDGKLVQTETSDNTASYSARLKAKGNAYPLTIEVSGGTDLVTNRPPDFKLTSVVSHPSVKSVNINPFTTIVVESARVMPGGITDANLTAARQAVTKHLNFGLDPALVADPVNSALTDNNVAVMVKASEALGEVVRRTRDHLQAAGMTVTADEVIASISDDMIDGIVDGVGGANANPRIAALTTLTSAQVLVEAMSNHLRVDGVVATGALDSAIMTTHPSVRPDALTAAVRLNSEMLSQARKAVAAARALAPSIELSTIATVLAQVSDNSLPSQVEPMLPADTYTDFDPVLLLASSASEQELSVVNETMRLDGDTTGTDPSNTAPSLSGTPPAVVAEDSVYLFEPTAFDADGDALTFAIQNPPSWASFDASSGRLSGAPDNSHVGTYQNIVISVSDGQAGDSIGPFDITVSNANDAPRIGGTAPGSVAAGTAYSFQPDASDPDGDPLSFSIVNPPRWASFDSSTGLLSGTPSSSDAGLFSDIVISVSDGSATASLAPFSISVQAVALSNGAPVIGGAPAASVAEDSAYAFQPSASDPDGDSLSFSIRNRPSWASFSTSTGRLAGTPRNADVGSYSNISITVSDGSAAATLGPFSITVINTNDAPTISGTPSTTVEEGSFYSFRPAASDPDGDTLRFSIQNRPGWAAFDSATGRLSGTPGAANVGSYENVVISVSDGSATAALSAFTLSVSALSVQTGSASLSWAAPTSRSDGTALALTEIAGYTLYYGASEGSYSSSIDIDDPFATSLTVRDLPVGSYYFVITAKDVDGRESAYSDPAQRLVQ